MDGVSSGALEIGSVVRLVVGNDVVLVRITELGTAPKATVLRSLTQGTPVYEWLIPGNRNEIFIGYDWIVQENKWTE